MNTIKYLPTIGIEVHAELNTESKMFCSCKNDPFNSIANTLLCPVCTGQPGALPVLNEEAIKSVIKVGIAIGGKPATFTEWDRKNYFYPDLPKAYQLSQYKYPLILGGTICNIPVTRIHLEEDTAQSEHIQSSGTLINFNRAGVPLLELVTEPAIHSAREAASFCKELQKILKILNVSNAQMEKGQMRVEANISVSQIEGVLGSKVEIKNLNSFRSMEKAIEFEIDRQIKVIEQGGNIAQETRGWDEIHSQTFIQRSKEGAADYRYYPDPDIPKLLLPTGGVSISRDGYVLRELPEEKRSRYSSLGLSTSSAIALENDEIKSSLFDEIVHKSKDSLDIKLLTVVANLILNEVGITKLSSLQVLELSTMIYEESVSSKAAKQVVSLVLDKQALSIYDTAKAHNLLQVTDRVQITDWAQVVISKSQSIVTEYKNGKFQVIGVLVAGLLKESRGSASPKIAKEILEELMQG
jgi:aspartyl-tRNA(Asn)/glutamyl-tRNA(Gln) amidotransferase subunit B